MRHPSHSASHPARRACWRCELRSTTAATVAYIGWRSPRWASRSWRRCRCSIETNWPLPGRDDRHPRRAGLKRPGLLRCSATQAIGGGAHRFGDRVSELPRVSSASAGPRGRHHRGCVRRTPRPPLPTGPAASVRCRPRGRREACPDPDPRRGGRGSSRAGRGRRPAGAVHGADGSRQARPPRPPTTQMRSRHRPFGRGGLPGEAEETSGEHGTDDRRVSLRLRRTGSVPVRGR